MNRNCLLWPVVPLLISGCSNYAPAPSPWDHASGDQLFVIAQLCVPAEPTRNLLVIDAVKSFGIDGKQLSISGGAQPRAWLTVGSQPVFEVAVSRQVDAKAVVVTLDGATFIYRLSDLELNGSWSTWATPYSQNLLSEQSWYKLVHDQKIERHEPNPIAPRIRYRLERLHDYRFPGERKRDGSIEVVPLCQ